MTTLTDYGHCTSQERWAPVMTCQRGILLAYKTYVGKVVVQSVNGADGGRQEGI
jgi:hypothetical protein